MNRKLKCGLSALLALVLIVTMAVSVPATAAESVDGSSDDDFIYTEDLHSSDITDSMISDLYVDEAVDDEDIISVGAQDEEFIAQALEEPSEEAVDEPEEDPTDPTAPITKVAGLKQNSIDASAITLSWNAVEGAEGYHVYWRNLDVADSSLSLLSTVNDTSLTIRNLSAGALYQFNISAYITKDGNVIDGDAATLKAGTRPGNVKNFIRTYCGSYIKLTWTAADKADGYILYRKCAATGGKYVKYKTLGKNVTSYNDTNVTKRCAYYYRLASYRSASTNIVGLAETEVRTVCGLQAPANNGSKLVLNRVFLKWKKSAAAEGYRIFYSTNNKTFKLLKTTTATSFTTHRLGHIGTKYYFKIYPYKHVGAKRKLIYGTCLKLNYTPTTKIYGKDAGNTRVEVSIAEQHLWFYKNGELLVSTDVVTGNNNSMDTPKGFWKVQNKASPCTLSGPGYSSYVNYWIAFIGSGYGIHDASWRSSFGGNIYKGNGSHGCVNTPYSKVKIIYKNISVGTPVVVY